MKDDGLGYPEGAFWAEGVSLCAADCGHFIIPGDAAICVDGALFHATCAIDRAND